MLSFLLPVEMMFSFLLRPICIASKFYKLQYIAYIYYIIIFINLKNSKQAKYCLFFRMLLPTILAQQIISSREKLLLTQAEVAELAGVSLRTVRAIEAGQANPGLRQLNHILDALGLNLVVQLKT